MSRWGVGIESRSGRDDVVVEISNADAGVRGDGAAGVQLARGLAVLAPCDADRIRQSLLEYG